MSGRCPACGEGRVFDGVLEFHAACPVCHLSFEQHDVADGPAFLVMMILCVLLALGAALLELWVEPPLWGHLILWPIVTILLCVPMLRFFRAVMLIHTYRVRPDEFDYNEDM